MRKIEIGLNRDFSKLQITRRLQIPAGWGCSASVMNATI